MPLSPNAGARPSFLAGREGELDRFRVLLARLRDGRTEQSMVFTGLRGVGKTVLLGEFERVAREEDWVTVDDDISRRSAFAPRMAQLARRALLSLAPRSRWRERATSAARVLKSFCLGVQPDGSLTLGLDVEPADGLGNSGSLGDDLTDLLVALGEAAVENGRGVAFLFDEIHYLLPEDLEALIRALHKTVQRALPVTLVAAGLPQIPRLAGEAGSYAERLFTFPRIERLALVPARDALVGPAEELGISYDDAAVEVVLRYTEGYPYFLQEYGRVLWDYSRGPRVTEYDARAAQLMVEAKLDESFFRVRAERTTGAELRYLVAMAHLGPEPQQAREVARALGSSSDKLGPIRSRLIGKGLLYTPGYGHAAFTVPQFDRYLRRAHPIA